MITRTLVMHYIIKGNTFEKKYKLIFIALRPKWWLSSLSRLSAGMPSNPADTGSVHHGYRTALINPLV